MSNLSFTVSLTDLAWTVLILGSVLFTIKLRHGLWNILRDITKSIWRAKVGLLYALIAHAMVVSLTYLLSIAVYGNFWLDRSDRPNPIMLFIFIIVGIIDILVLMGYPYSTERK